MADTEQPEAVIRIVVVDDDPMVRTGLTLMMGLAADLDVVAEAADGAEALDVVAREKPDVVLMDIRMPRMDGLEATRRLCAGTCPPKVIVLTTFDTDDVVLRALDAGASGFLLKDTPPPRMITAIRSAADGEPALSPSVAQQVMAAATSMVGGQRRHQALEELEVLAEREREVAVSIAKGHSNAEIATELFMSVATVKAHVTRIFTKLDVDNRVQVAMKIHDAGLV